MLINKINFAVWDESRTFAAVFTTKANMKKILIPMLLALLAAGCRQSEGRGNATLQCMASYQLGALAELRLMTDGDLSQLEMYYGEELQELVGTANTAFCTDSMGRIALDTVHLDDTLSTQYIVRTYDRSSTYGAEVWYVVYPYRADDPDGPWNLVKLPTDRPTIEDVERSIR